MLITIYTPVCGPVEGNEIPSDQSWFTVNGATSEDRDTAIALASKHVSIRDGRCEVKRVDETKMHDYEFYE